MNPAKRETRLKATTDRAFSSLSVSKADVMKRLVYLAGRAERELIPIQSMAQVPPLVVHPTREALTTAQHLIPAWP